jgi:hypothetical protein
MRIVIADILEKIKIESPSSYSVQKSKENPVLLLEMSSLLNRSFLNLCEFFAVLLMLGNHALNEDFANIGGCFIIYN